MRLQGARSHRLGRLKPIRLSIANDGKGTNPVERGLAGERRQGADSCRSEAAGLAGQRMRSGPDLAQLATYNPTT